MHVRAAVTLSVLVCATVLRPQAFDARLPIVQVEPQPLAAQAARIADALDYVGAPLAPADRAALRAAAATSRRIRRDPGDPRSPLPARGPHQPGEPREGRAGPARAELVEHGWRVFLVKVRNEAGVTAPLRVSSPQARPVFARGPRGFSMDPRPAQTIPAADVADRWLDLELFDKPPLAAAPLRPGRRVPHRPALSRDAGKREAKLASDVGQGTQDLGFRSDVPILFTRPAARRRDAARPRRRRPADHRRVHDPRRAGPRLSVAGQAPGARLLLPPPGLSRRRRDRAPAAGVYAVEVHPRAGVLCRSGSASPSGASRRTASFALDALDRPGGARLVLRRSPRPRRRLPALREPDQGVEPRDMMRHILGEDLNVGCVLTWGPCWYHQKQFFEGKDHPLSTPRQPDALRRRGLGLPLEPRRAPLLLRLKEDDYPGTTTIEEWPSWDLPVLKWGKAQGGVVGFSHSGWGLRDRSDTTLPTYEMPPFDGIGANEYIVDVTHDAVDFISTVDTPAPWELNIWYHTLNCGFRTRISGETDFPCIYGERVGLGRSYVKLDRQARLRPLGRGHQQRPVLRLRRQEPPGRLPGRRRRRRRSAAARSGWRGPGTVKVTAQVAARLDPSAPDDGDPRQLPLDKKPYWDLERAPRSAATREVPVEVVVNGRVAATQRIDADGSLRDARRSTSPIERAAGSRCGSTRRRTPTRSSSLVDGKPIRASKKRPSGA